MSIRSMLTTVAAFSLAGVLYAADPATKPAAPAPAAPAAAAPATPAAPAAKEVTTASGLKIVEVQAGEPGARKGDVVWVQYTGKLTDGKKFDSSYDHGGEPFRFELGKGEVIRGWDEGIEGMTVGQKRQLIVPPALGYGAQGAGKDIPPNATLIFDVELIGLARPGQK